MKLSLSLVAFGLAIVVISEPISVVSRDLAAFQGIISDIDGQVDALQAAIDGFSGGDGAAVQGASDDLVATIRAGIETANAQPQLTNSEALQLTAPVQDLTEKVNTAIDALIAKKQQFVDAGLGPAIQESLAEQHAASTDLATAISSKVPPALEEIARELSAGISNAIQRGIDEYADVGPVPSGTAEPSETAQPSETAEPTAEPSETEEPTAEPTAEPSETGEPTAPVYPTGEPEPTSGAVYPTGGVTPPPSSPPFDGAGSGIHAPVVGVAAALVAVAAYL